MQGIKHNAYPDFLGELNHLLDLPWRACSGLELHHASQAGVAHIYDLAVRDRDELQRVARLVL